MGGFIEGHHRTFKCVFFMFRSHQLDDFNRALSTRFDSILGGAEEGLFPSTSSPSSAKLTRFCYTQFWEILEFDKQVEKCQKLSCRKTCIIISLLLFSLVSSIPQQLYRSPSHHIVLFAKKKYKYILVLHIILWSRGKSNTSLMLSIQSI